MAARKEPKPSSAMSVIVPILLIGVVVSIVNLSVDIVVATLDPRIDY